MIVITMDVDELGVGFVPPCVIGGHHKIQLIAVADSLKLSVVCPVLLTQGVPDLSL